MYQAWVLTWPSIRWYSCQTNSSDRLSWRVPRMRSWSKSIRLLALCQIIIMAIASRRAPKRSLAEFWEP